MKNVKTRIYILYINTQYMKAEMSGKICSFKSIEIDGDSGKVREGDRHSISLRFHMPRVELHPLDNLNKQDWHPGQGGKNTSVKFSQPDTILNSLWFKLK
uniref:Uncharacterized protein n=1 Tax=Anguilla anguilla TaxID=7936 RepID=A0A0E9WF85_ANGAN